MKERFQCVLLMAQTILVLMLLAAVVLLWFSPKKVAKWSAEFKVTYDSVLISHNKFYHLP